MFCFHLLALTGIVSACESSVEWQLHIRAEIDLVAAKTRQWMGWFIGEPTSVSQIRVQDDFDDIDIADLDLDLCDLVQREAAVPMQLLDILESISLECKLSDELIARTEAFGIDGIREYLVATDEEYEGYMGPVQSKGSAGGGSGLGIEVYCNDTVKMRFGGGGGGGVEKFQSDIDAGGGFGMQMYRNGMLSWGGGMGLLRMFPREDEGNSGRRQFCTAKVEMQKELRECAQGGGVRVYAGGGGGGGMEGMRMGYGFGFSIGTKKIHKESYDGRRYWVPFLKYGSNRDIILIDDWGKYEVSKEKEEQIQQVQ